MKHCRTCDSTVTADFARVYGDGESVLACHGCAPRAQIAQVISKRSAERDDTAGSPVPAPDSSSPSAR